MKTSSKTSGYRLLWLASSGILAGMACVGPPAAALAQPKAEPQAKPAPAEFQLNTLGSTQVTAGHDLYIVVSGTRAAGHAENTYIRVVQQPEGVSHSFPDIGRTCCGGGGDGSFLWQVDGSFSTSVRLSIPETLAPGSYSAAVEIKNSRARQTVRHSFTVVAKPAAVKPTFAALGAVPSLARYREQMLTKGRAQLGNREAILQATLWEGNAWYYDGTRVAYEIADYTGDASFAEFAKNPLDVYRLYVLDNKGGVPGWRVFPQGLRMHYERTGDVQSKQAAIALLNASYGPNGIVTKDLIPEGLSREVAYAIMTMLEAEKLGQPRHARLAEYVDIALGHCDQWFGQEKFERMAPFMFALTAEALIKYHEATGDVRVLPALQRGADWIWAKAWARANHAFVYELVPGKPRGEGAPDLNLLIVPVYGWIYRQTGDAAYIEKGDQIFAGGVVGAWLDQGKQFSQSYRWSMDYLKWRGSD